MAKMVYVEEFRRELTPGEMLILSRIGTAAERPADKLHVAKWRSVANGEPIVKSARSLPVALSCPHLKEPTGEVVGCPTCRGNVQLKVFACDLHGKTTLEKKVNDIQCCKTCPDNPVNKPVVVTFPPVTRRNLLYHVYPRRDGDWRTPINRLRSRIDLFDGTRTVAIAHDSTTEHPVMVEDSLAGLGIKFLRIPNNPNLREVETFLPLFESIENDRDPGSVTLYAHAKGVTRTSSEPALKWAETLAELCLDYWPVVDGLLTNYPVVGPFKKTGRGWVESKSDWHFSGSWHWFRNAVLFAKQDWRKIDKFWSGIEPYPSLHFKSSQAGCLFYESSSVDLYAAADWIKVGAALDAFRTANETKRTGLVSVPPDCKGLNFGCGPYYRDGWMNVDCSSSVKTDAVLARGAPLPFRSNSFDRVYLGHVLEHIHWEECVPLLREISRVLRPGGTICCVGPDLFKAIRRAVQSGGADADMRHIAECGEWQEFDGVPGRDHRWSCSENRLVMLLEHVGFAAVSPVELSSLIKWPVVSLDGAQSAVIGVKEPI